MSEILRNLFFSANQDRRDAYAEREAFDCSGWSPCLNTRQSSEQRAERAALLRNASREREEMTA